MAWSWSHSNEGLSNARDNLKKMEKEKLEIIYAEWRAAQDKDGVVRDHNKFNEKKYDRALKFAKTLPDDILVDFIWERAEEASTCDNGGFELWMCPSGCGPHCVTPDPTDDEGNEIPTEPEDDDWVTSDYIEWYTHNGLSKQKPFITDPDTWNTELQAHMEEEKFWPNAWYLGERGDWNLLDVTTGEYA